jgi:hypothetical protein
MPICVGIKTNGEHCGTRAAPGLTRCRVHQRTLESNGPFACARNEKYYSIRKEIRDFQTMTEELVDAAEGFRNRVNVREDREHELRLLELRLNRELELLSRQQQEEIERTGVDPDAPYRERHRLAQLEANQRREAQRQAMFNHVNNWVVAGNVAVGIIAAGGGPAPRVQADELLEMAQDNQSVHRTRVVEMTKQIVDRILRIPVPDEYKWNAQICSKTPGEIVVRCRLTPKAAWQMISKYCQAESIYEMGEGIYGKVLDGVWQYILKLEDSDGICRALRQEMEDSIGMCAQGNLTRICNILAGFMEGVGPQESAAEILGRKLPMILDIVDPLEQVNRAIAVFEEVNLPKSEWKNWLIAITDSMTDDDLKIVKPRLSEVGIA